MSTSWRTKDSMLNEYARNGIATADSIKHILKWIGDDPSREGLVETPTRMIAAWEELFSGYRKNVEDVFKTFADGACDELVILKNIEFYSTCEHHMLPFYGEAHIGYIPKGRVVGISKLARLLEVYSRRLQIQERIAEQVTAAMDKYLEPIGSACVIEAKHLCMACRGVNKQHSVMVTSSLTGVFRKAPSARAEFFSLLGSKP